MTPGICQVGFIFYFISSICPSFTLAKSSQPTNNKNRRKTALRDTACTGGADKFFLGWQDGQDLARFLDGTSK